MNARRLRERQEHVEDHGRAIRLEQEVELVGEPQRRARVHELAEQQAADDSDFGWTFVTPRS